MTKRKNIYPIAGKVVMAHLMGIKKPQLEYCDESKDFKFSDIEIPDINWELDPNYLVNQQINRKALLVKVVEYIGANVGLHMNEEGNRNWEEEIDRLNEEFWEVIIECQAYSAWINTWDSYGEDLLVYLKKTFVEELSTPQSASAIHLVAEYLCSTDEHTVKASTLRSLCNNQIPFGLLSYKTPNIAPEWASALESM